MYVHSSFFASFLLYLDYVIVSQKFWEGWLDTNITLQS